MKKLLLLISLILLTSPAYAQIMLDDIKTPKPASYRVGTTDDIEKEYKVKDSVKKQNVKQESKSEMSLEGLTYADLSIKKISQEISSDMEIDYNEMMSDLSLLWQGAAVKSDTIKYALYKL